MKHEQKHIHTEGAESSHDRELTAFLSWFQRIEDRLVLASLPVVIFALILWAVASAIPLIATAINLVISILIILITCVMLLRLVEIGWRWTLAGMESDDIDPAFVFGDIGIIALLIGGVACLIDTIMHAGIASDSRTALFVGLLVLLALQYRAIIHRHMTKSEA